GEGDAIYFQKVKPGSHAEKAGVQVGDELLQVNFSDPKILFWRPAEEILPAIFGPVMLWWRPRPPEKAGERTRVNLKKPKLYWHEDEDEDKEEPSQFPVARASVSGDGEWKCGSCQGNNFDTQEYCRRCGLRDSRLPKRPGAMPRRNLDERKGAPKVCFGTGNLSKQEVQQAATAGQLFADPPGMHQESAVKSSRRLK
ncbi:unnamed protein product, partial [Polarella glacialis]